MPTLKSGARSCRWGPLTASLAIQMAPRVLVAPLFLIVQLDPVVPRAQISPRVLIAARAPVVPLAHISPRVLMVALVPVVPLVPALVADYY